MQVSTREMAADFDLEEDEDGEVVLVLRAGLIPRRTLYALGTLLEEVHAVRDVPARRE